MKYVFYLLVISLIINCNKVARDSSTNYLEVYFMRPNIKTPFSYPCTMLSKEILKEDLNFKKIDNKEDFGKFITMYNDYQATNDSAGINVRIKIVVHNKNKIDTLCLGEYFGTYKNGVKVNDNEKILTFIKERIDFNNTLPPLVKSNLESYKK